MTELIKASENGQWEILEKDNSVKPFGQSVYNTTANIKRKANRTGEVQEGVGRNNAVHSYTTSGSSVQAAHEATQAKDMQAKTKASTRTLADMSDEEKTALEAKYGAKIKKDEMCKAEKQSNSVFTMNHAHEVADMPHHEGKAHLHSLVESSTANPENKSKIKAAIDNSKNPRHLSSMVANHVLAAGGSGHKPGSLKVIS